MTQGGVSVCVVQQRDGSLVCAVGDQTLADLRLPRWTICYHEVDLWINFGPVKSWTWKNASVTRSCLKFSCG